MGYYLLKKVIKKQYSDIIFSQNNTKNKHFHKEKKHILS